MINNSQNLNSTLQLFGRVLDKSTSESYNLIPNIFYEIKQVTLDDYAIVAGTIYTIPLKNLELRILENTAVEPIKLEAILKFKLKKGI